MAIREVQRLLTGQPMSEGAGVRLRRAFAGASPNLDPFLLFDDFSSHREEDYIAGFPWHPHRGMETVTYILSGEVEHKDSIGNAGSITAGDVQWMSAGSGIIHQEMPQKRTDGICGFQLWVNLPKSAKMESPKYRDIAASSIPETVVSGAHIKIIAGGFEDVSGAVSDIAGAPSYLDVSLEKRATFEYPVRTDNTVLLYILDGQITVGTKREAAVAGTMVVTEHGDTVHVESPDGSSRFLLLSGTPLNESVAWHGPIVMNTQEELLQAFSELKTDTFIKPPAS